MADDPEFCRLGEPCDSGYGGGNPPPSSGGSTYIPPTGGERRPPPDIETDDGEEPGRPLPRKSPPWADKIIPAIATEVVPFHWNHRFKGHREAFKFNLVLQQTLSTISKFTNLSKALMNTLESLERTVMYPTDEEISLFYGTWVQLKFREYHILRDANVRWFT